MAVVRAHGKDIPPRVLGSVKADIAQSLARAEQIGERLQEKREDHGGNCLVS